MGIGAGRGGPRVGIQIWRIFDECQQICEALDSSFTVQTAWRNLCDMIRPVNSTELLLIRQPLRLENAILQKQVVLWLKIACRHYLILRQLHKPLCRGIHS